MNRKISYLSALAITFVLAASYYTITGFSIIELEQIEIKRVIDGDTIVDNKDRTIRLLNINSPEKSVPESKLSTDFLKSFQNKSLQLQITSQDKYQRLLGKLYYQDDYINLLLVENGLASKFLVDESELKSFSKAEESAIKSSRGIWKKSENYGCISSEIDPENEFVILEISCDISLDGYYMKDESRKTYTFKNIKIDKIVLHSLIGKDNETDLFWNSKQNVWNNNRDSLYIFDSSGKLVHSDIYGY